MDGVERSGYGQTRKEITLVRFSFCPIQSISFVLFKVLRIPKSIYMISFKVLRVPKNVPLVHFLTQSAQSPPTKVFHLSYFKLPFSFFTFSPFLFFLVTFSPFPFSLFLISDFFGLQTFCNTSDADTVTGQVTESVITTVCDSYSL